MTSSGCTNHMSGQVKTDLTEMPPEALQVSGSISASPLKLNGIWVWKMGHFPDHSTSPKLFCCCPPGAGESKRLARERHATVLWSQMEAVVATCKDRAE